MIYSAHLFKEWDVCGDVNIPGLFSVGRDYYVLNDAQWKMKQFFNTCSRKKLQYNIRHQHALGICELRKKNMKKNINNNEKRCTIS